ncbi:MAG: PTS fructose transporter subunit IIB [Acholeplasmataceae bacterium]|jgi:PTS system fructose-specific IIC component|nr:PTS fructose transporter subunit IIB [Acholeplasmataceae bacterium]
MKKIVCVTACPTGIAHTYMAAEMLETAGKALGVDIKCETNGSIGVENPLTKKDIAESIGVIIASDIRIDKKRFHGKPLIDVPIRKGIQEAYALIQRLLDGYVKVYDHTED